jgi:hypothetical protein
MRRRVYGFLQIAGPWVLLLSLSALATGLVGGQLQGLQQVRAAQQQQAAPQTPAHQKQTFEGRITRSGEKLVLEDKTDGSFYQLDDQQLAAFFEGQEVKLTGAPWMPKIAPFTSLTWASRTRSTRKRELPHKGISF